MLALGIDLNQAGWVQQNFITVDTEAINARSNKAFIEAVARFAKEATRFDGLDLPADQRRQLDLLRLSLVMAAPNDEKEATELTTIAARMDGVYGRGKWCPDAARSPRPASTSRPSPRSWRTAATRNGCAKCGRAGTRSRCRCARTMSASRSCRTRGPRSWALATPARCGDRSTTCRPMRSRTEMDRLWDQVRPLYLSLHAYMRMKLRDQVRRSRAGEGTDSGALARQHLGTELGEPLQRRRAEDRRARLRSHRDPDDAKDLGDRHGEIRRALLRVARTGAAAADLLRAVAARKAATIATWCATPAPGQSTLPTTCASRCASTRRPKTSSRSTTSSATTSISAPTRTCRCCSATAPTTAFTRRSATRSACR